MARNLETKPLSETFEYRDGGLYRKIPVRGSKVGARFGGITKTPSGNQYRRGKFNGEDRFEHGLIAELVGLDVPSGSTIDHIDGNGLNNKASNLRVATYSENARNRRLMKSNSSGVCGVHYALHAKKWNATIKLDNRSRNLGYYDTIFDAAAARISESNKAGFHANHGNKRT